MHVILLHVPTICNIQLIEQKNASVGFGTANINLCDNEQLPRLLSEGQRLF